jgi:hypothetical protein
MAVQLISIAKRPSTDILWTNDPTNDGWFKNDNHYLETWHEKGRLLSTTTTFSEDGLTVTVIREFSDWQALDDFVCDVNLNEIRRIRSAYNDSVGIEITHIETIEV